MSNNFKSFCLFFLFSSVLFASTPINLSTEEKEWIKNNPTVSYSEVNWKPLSIIENNRMNGIMGDFLDLVSTKTGLEFTFIASDSWPHVLEQFSQNKIDIVPGIGSSESETKLGLVSKEYASYPMVIVTSDKYKYIAELKELEGKTVAVPKYYTSYNFLANNYPKINLVTTQNIPEALLLVEKGKADAFIGHIATSLYYITDNYLDNLKVTGTTAFNFDHHYLIQKDSPILLSIINKTFDSITYQEKKEIYENWIQTSIVEETIDYRAIFIILLISLLIVTFFMYRQKLLKGYNNKLKNSYKEIQDIMNSTLDGIIISQDNVCINANTSALKLLQCKKEQLIGTKIIDFIPDNCKEKVFEKLKEPNLEPYETDVLTFEGNIIPVLVKGTNINFDNKKIRVSSFVDISELRQKEKLVIEQSKMFAVGEMIGNISHQWRQPLNLITTVANNWKACDELGMLEKDEMLKESEIIVSNATQLSKIIDDFMYFFKEEDKTSDFSIDELIASLLRLEGTTLKMNQINFISNVNSSKTIAANKNRLLQALLNITNNSIEALVDNLEENRTILFDVEEKEEEIVLKITDNAGGIPAEILSKVLEPYISTKENLNGLGLGLYMTYIIVEKMNGKIVVENRSFEIDNVEYKGTQISIFIPLS